MARKRRDVDGKLYGHGLLRPREARSRGTLQDEHLFAPFSVWNTREGFWQDRKRRWMSLGIESEVGRDGTLTFNIPLHGFTEGLSDLTHTMAARNGYQTSIFDPVVAELCPTWWCPPGGIIVDPFAGGSVRGIVASVLGFRYWGCELRREQVDANRAQLNDKTTGTYRPKWVCGDSAERLDESPRADFIFSCPPYGNLERYSDDPADISAMAWEDFCVAYTDIIEKAVARLRDNRFAAFVVGNFRDKVDARKMRHLVGVTVDAFTYAGCEFYNDIILVNSVGTGALRARNNFERGARKIVKLHQNVLVFVKGDPRVADGRIKEETK